MKKIKWDIDYLNKTAKCSQMSVKIREVETPTVQEYDGVKISFGFMKIESKKMYQCTILFCSKTLLSQSKIDNKILPYYASQLGDTFKE